MCVCVCVRASVCVCVAAPPDYSALAVSEEHRRDCLQGSDWSPPPEEAEGSLQAYITEFRYLPPPLYAEVTPVRLHGCMSVCPPGVGLCFRNALRGCVG